MTTAYHVKLIWKKDNSPSNVPNCYRLVTRDFFVISKVQHLAYKLTPTHLWCVNSKCTSESGIDRRAYGDKAQCYACLNYIGTSVQPWRKVSFLHGATKNHGLPYALLALHPYFPWLCPPCSFMCSAAGLPKNSRWTSWFSPVQRRISIFVLLRRGWKTYLLLVLVVRDAGVLWCGHLLYV